MTRASNNNTPVPAKKTAMMAATTAAPKPAPPSPLAGQARGPVTGRITGFEASLEFFLAPLRPFLADPEVTEIMVNGPERIYIEKGGRLTLTTASFPSELDVQAAGNNIAQFVGQPLSQERPILDGRLPDGSRVCVVLGPIAESGTQINIRRFVRSAVTPQFLIDRQSLTPMAMEFLLLNVKAHRNVLVVGGAGSGKTTVLNVLTTAFDPTERVVVIEDTRELQIQCPHVVQMEARTADAYGRGAITIRDLFITTLRMRPDRLIVGEVRRGEALDLIQAMTSGHRGALATLHAASAIDACHRIETMALMADVGLPLFALRRQVASAIDLLVQTVRLPTGPRLISSISEVAFDEEKSNYIITDLFTLADSDRERQLQWTGQKSELRNDPAMTVLSEQVVLTADLLGLKGT